MPFGKRIYYDKASGNVLLVAPQMKHPEAVDTGVDFDFTIYPVLMNRVRESVGVVELEIDQYQEEFSIGSDFRVNTETGELEFAYRNPGEESQPEPIYQPPLSEQVAALKVENADLLARLGDIELALADVFSMGEGE
ncbi:hypothetical protein [Paenibacillus glufosinatiresistens]|uniref:hypothetical protein n=1 Tax=Paenibacillus glufosinatiresistens TaxID=3070657 RepID=UPI00286E4251|nr:hypothetical protein [Paenibacillus sp. YX.27]